MEIRVVMAEGKTLVEVDGHAGPTACTAVSAITNACVLGLIAASEFKDVQVTVNSDRPEEWREWAAAARSHGGTVEVMPS